MGIERRAKAVDLQRPDRAFGVKVEDPIASVSSARLAVGDHVGDGDVLELVMAASGATCSPFMTVPSSSSIQRSPRPGAGLRACREVDRASVWAGAQQHASVGAISEKRGPAGQIVAPRSGWPAPGRQEGALIGGNCGRRPGL